MSRFVEIRRDDTWELVGVMDLSESPTLSKALLERKPVVKLHPLESCRVMDLGDIELAKKCFETKLIEVVTLILDELRLDRDKKVFHYLVMSGDINNLHKCRGFRCPERWA